MGFRNILLGVVFTIGCESVETRYFRLKVKSFEPGAPIKVHDGKYKGLSGKLLEPIPGRTDLKWSVQLDLDGSPPLQILQNNMTLEELQSCKWLKKAIPKCLWKSVSPSHC